MNRIDVLKKHLSDLDWVNAKLKDLELNAESEGKTEEEIKQLRSEYYQKYQEIYNDRADTRNKIDELEGGN